jgi:hypothetical protein
MRTLLGAFTAVALVALSVSASQAEPQFHTVQLPDTPPPEWSEQQYQKDMEYHKRFGEELDKKNGRNQDGRTNPDTWDSMLRTSRCKASDSKSWRKTSPTQGTLGQIAVSRLLGAESMPNVVPMRRAKGR